MVGEAKFAKGAARYRGRHLPTGGQAGDAVMSLEEHSTDVATDNSFGSGDQPTTAAFPVEFGNLPYRLATTSEGARPSSGQDNAQQPLIDQVQALTQRIADLEGERQNVTAQKRALQLKHKNEMSQQRRDFESRIGQLKSQMSNVQLQLKNQTSINNRMAHSFAATTQDVATLREAKLNKVHFETLQKSFQDLYERVSGLETPIGTYLETEAVEAYDAYSPVMDDRDTLNDLMGYKNLCERLEGDFERFQEEKQRDDAHMEARATAQAAQINAQTAQINQQAAQINQQAAQINALMQMMAQVNLNLNAGGPGGPV